jgi:hypothetical protein
MCFLFCLTFSLGVEEDLSVDISQAATLVLPRVVMKSMPIDCPKVQHLSWPEGNFHQLESTFGYQNQTVKKIILKSLALKVSVAGFIIIWIQEFD